MISAVQLGPMLLPFTLLLVFASAGSMLALGKWLAVLALQSTSGQKLPELSFTSVEGETVYLKAFEGKPTVVNLWATWCPPCAREMPVLHEAQRQHPEVNFVFLNQGDEAEQVSRWLESRRLTLRNVLLDPRRQTGAAFQQQGYPTTLFFNAKGELVSSRIGELSSPTLNEKLKALTR